MEKTKYLAMKRAERLAALQGKFVIVTDSKYNKHQILYYQDQSVCSKGFWTAFMVNAKGYETEQEAEQMLKKLKFNNPRIMKIS